MEKIYSMQILSDAEDYIVLDGDLASLSTIIGKDDIQLLTTDPVTFGLADEGGLDVPDVIMQQGVLFVSDKLKNELLENGQDQLFFKKATVEDDHFGIHETLWITVPPRIDCIDWARSEYEESAMSSIITPMSPIKMSRLILDPNKAGRYQIFRLRGVDNDLIYVRESLHKRLVSKEFEALSFTQR